MISQILLTLRHYFLSAKHLSTLPGIALLLPIAACAQTEPTEALRSSDSPVKAFTNATIVVEPGRELNDATLVIRGGVVDKVGTDVEPPPDAHVLNMEGRTIYPGFIDPYTDTGMKDPRMELEQGAISWNPQIRAQLRAEEEFDRENDGSEQLRSQGFTTAQTVPPVGIFRGQTAVFNLGSGNVSDRVVKSDVAHAVAQGATQDLDFSYPNSIMGAMALIRQTLLDAEWYQKAHAAYEEDPNNVKRPETNVALKALEKAAKGDQPILMESRYEKDFLRTINLTDEFPITPWVKGSGYEYRVLDVITEADIPLILPVDFPETPDVQAPEDALNKDLEELRHWYLAPENPARLSDAGINFSFTTDGLDSPSEFINNVRKAIKLGLDADEALAALTTNPSSLLGIDQTHGTLEEGKAANLVVAEGDLFETSADILDVWVEGERFRINEVTSVDPRGEWAAKSYDGTLEGTLKVEETRPGQLGGTFTYAGEEIELSSAGKSDQARRFRADFPGDELNIDGQIRLSASVSADEMNGWAELPAGERIQWHGERTAHPEEDELDDLSVPPRDVELADIRPDMEYGREQMPDQPEHVVVRDATIWTMGPEGILENADLLVTNGEVAEVGQNLDAPGNAKEIDGSGKHVTPGLIDAHLHSGIDGVNEFGDNIVPEVQMGDVLNINNIWMYRQLAGGLTTAHLMHGSANPIGGQNQHIKLRWGGLPDELKFQDAPGTVKVALGENVVRRDNYPDTRMGVEQIVADRFREARDYEARWEEWEQAGEGQPPRRDLRMEALLGIMDGEILIQSHSYRQDEILMLTRLAERFDIDIKAFHHGVEAYKVAPELAEHGAGAVVWSDWSSFKIEAYDATVYNARLLSEAGVLTSLHSDNSQIAARMNWEAAKMVRAGMDKEEALALITINTAKLLGIDDRVGSLEPGKDGDFVLWSGDPLSKMTRAEQTWIDGRRFFDLDEHSELLQDVESQRSDLIQLILEENQ